MSSLVRPSRTWDVSVAFRALFPPPTPRVSCGALCPISDGRLPSRGPNLGSNPLDAGSLRLTSSRLVGCHSALTGRARSAKVSISSAGQLGCRTGSASERVGRSGAEGVLQLLTRSGQTADERGIWSLASARPCSPANPPGLLSHQPPSPDRQIAPHTDRQDGRERARPWLASSSVSVPISTVAADAV